WLQAHGGLECAQLAQPRLAMGHRVEHSQRGDIVAALRRQNREGGAETNADQQQLPCARAAHPIAGVQHARDPAFHAFGIGIVARAVAATIEVETQRNETAARAGFGKVTQRAVRANVIHAERRDDDDTERTGPVRLIQPAEAWAILRPEPAGARTKAVFSDRYPWRGICRNVAKGIHAFTPQPS